MDHTKLVAMDRFATGSGVGAYHPGDVITDADTWPEGSLQTRLERGSVAYVPAHEAPVEAAAVLDIEPVVEETVVEETVVEEAVVEEPVAEEPVAEEPVSEDPKPASPARRR
jgi:hypothetical protein